jgi:uncharacterized protein YdeI (YjbR/CyaY-like superfamily)
MIVFCYISLSMIKTEKFERVEVVSVKELRQWLRKNYNQKEGIWLVTYKKHVIDKYISISEVLDELLCFGWIDGIRRKLNDDKTMQLISPRKIEHWTKTYKDRYAKLLEENRMTEAGKKAVKHSKKAGLWNFMDDVDKLIKPNDFVVCLKQHPPALKHFNNFGPSSQRFILRWIKLAKTTKTRKNRIVLAATLAAENKKIPGL